MTTTCRICQVDITANEKEDSKFVICNKCTLFTAKGSVKMSAVVENANKVKKPRGNSLKETIMNFIGTKEKVTLHEIYAGVPSNRDSIRAVLNISVSKGDGLTRVEKGVYALIR